jgi:ActR/RegA family two-component response regulator
MNALIDDRQLLVLVDDDAHSARLLVRTLAERGSGRIEWLGGGLESARLLSEMLDENNTQWPGLVVVDLKTSSLATRDFIAGFMPLANAKGVLVVAMAQSLDRELRESLLEAGAAAVFQRHADIEAYRAEADAIISFWARHQRKNQVFLE